MNQPPNLSDIDDRVHFRGKYALSDKERQLLLASSQSGQLVTVEATLTPQEQLRLIEIAASTTHPNIREAAIKLVHEAQHPLVLKAPTADYSSAHVALLSEGGTDTFSIAPSSVLFLPNGQNIKNETTAVAHFRLVMDNKAL